MRFVVVMVALYLMGAGLGRRSRRSRHFVPGLSHAALRVGVGRFQCASSPESATPRRSQITPATVLPPPAVLHSPRPSAGAEYSACGAAVRLRPRATGRRR